MHVTFQAAENRKFSRLEDILGSVQAVHRKLGVFKNLYSALVLLSSRREGEIFKTRTGYYRRWRKDAGYYKFKGRKINPAFFLPEKRNLDDTADYTDLSKFPRRHKLESRVPDQQVSAMDALGVVEIHYAVWKIERCGRSFDRTNFRLSKYLEFLKGPHRFYEISGILKKLNRRNLLEIREQMKIVGNSVEELGLEAGKRRYEGVLTYLDRAGIRHVI